MLAYKKNLKLHAVFYDRDMSCQSQKTAGERRAGDKALKTAGEKLALCRQERQFRSLKSSTASILQQTNLRNIAMNKNPRIFNRTCESWCQGSTKDDEKKTKTEDHIGQLARMQLTN